MNHLSILMPVYNDWESVSALIEKLEVTCCNLATHITVYLVNDGSSKPPPSSLTIRPNSPEFSVQLINLIRNLGHQRAIAIALAYLQVEGDRTDAAIVLDSDGEDNPEDIPKLLEVLREQGGNAIVFALRSRRSEGFVFQIGYFVYTLLFRCLTGQSIRFGNFSAIPGPMIARVAAISENWNHYAAACMRSRIPLATVPIERAKRIAGKSRMNFVNLVAHGLSAVSVFSDIAGVRMLVAAGTTGLFISIGIFIVFYIRLATDLAIPGWATNVTGLLLILLIQLFGIALQFTFVILQGRITASFLPLRDYSSYILTKSQ